MNNRINWHPLSVYMFQTIRVQPDRMRIFSKYLYGRAVRVFFQNTYTVGPYAYGLPSFKRLSRLQKYLRDQRYSNLKYIKKKLIIAIVQFRNKLIQTGTTVGSVITLTTTHNSISSGLK
jgi:hypothetical protein